MDIQAEKIELTKLLLNTESTQIIEDIKKVFAKYLNKKDFWDEMTLEQKEIINQSEKQVNKGESYSYEQLKEKLGWA